MLNFLWQDQLKGALWMHLITSCIPTHKTSWITCKPFYWVFCSFAFICRYVQSELPNRHSRWSVSSPLPIPAERVWTHTANRKESGKPCQFIFRSIIRCKFSSLLSGLVYFIQAIPGNGYFGNSSGYHCQRLTTQARVEWKTLIWLCHNHPFVISSEV